MSFVFSLFVIVKVQYMPIVARRVEVSQVHLVLLSEMGGG